MEESCLAVLGVCAAHEWPQRWWLLLLLLLEAGVHSVLVSTTRRAHTGGNRWSAQSATKACDTAQGIPRRSLSPVLILPNQA